MNKANKITMSRIIMSLIIITIMLFPFDQVGLEFPTYTKRKYCYRLKIYTSRNTICNSLIYWFLRWTCG